MKFIKNNARIQEQDDAALIARYKSGSDLEALGALYNKYMHLVFGVCLNYLKDEEQSKDAVMQIFEELVVKLKIHDDLLFILPSGETITKEMDLNTYRNGALKVDELLPDIEKLNIIDDMAVITLSIKLSGKFNDVPFEASYRYIRVWKKFGDGIKVIGGSGIAIR